MKIEILEADRPENEAEHTFVVGEPRFRECDTCSAKPGSPTLCSGCLNNRELIERYEIVVKATQNYLALNEK